MNKLNKNELIKINGGGISGTLINGITTAGKFLYNMGRVFGSSMRRIIFGRVCSI